MKNNLLAVMFLFLCLLSTLLSVWFAVRYNTSIHKFRDLQPKLAQASTAQSIFQAMVNDTAEYNKTARNPDITRILQPYLTPAKASKPAAK